MSDDSEAKTKPASNRKLSRLRRDGSLPANAESSGYIGACAGLVTAFAMSGVTISVFVALFNDIFVSLSQPFDQIVPQVPGLLSRALLIIVIPVVGAAIIAAFIAALLYNGGFIFAAKSVVPQLSRVSLTSGFARIYGRRGWIETGVSIVRLILWLAALSFVAAIWLPRMFEASECGLVCQGKVTFTLAVLAVLIAIVVFSVSAAFDMAIQKNLFLFEQMMSESELKQERKESLGDPGIRKERRRRMKETPPDQKAVGKDKANIWVFSEDDALGIRYLPKEDRVPRVSARLSGEDAAQVRNAIATTGRLPLVENKLLVAGCGSATLGGAMPSDLYEEFAQMLNDNYQKA